MGTPGDCTPRKRSHSRWRDRRHQVLRHICCRIPFFTFSTMYQDVSHRHLIPFLPQLLFLPEILSRADRIHFRYIGTTNGVNSCEYPQEGLAQVWHQARFHPQRSVGSTCNDDDWNLLLRALDSAPRSIGKKRKRGLSWSRSGTFACPFPRRPRSSRPTERR